jgi:DNA primase
MQYHHKSFLQAIEHILSLANITLEEKEYSEIYEYLKRNNINTSKKDVQHEYLPKNVMHKYSKERIQEWLDAGISQKVLDKYEVRLDKTKNAVVFPIRDIQGRIVAVKARTLYPNYRDLAISKYFYYNSIGTNDFLFGLYQNYQSIKEKSEVIVLEGAKGVMLAESCGYDNCVSLETNTINEDQMNILLRLKVDVVVCLDKGIKIITGKIKNPAKEVSIGLLSKLTNVYIMEDKYNMLQDKDCPADKGKETFDLLYERRYRI